MTVSFLDKGLPSAVVTRQIVLLINMETKIDCFSTKWISIPTQVECFSLICLERDGLIKNLVLVMVVYLNLIISKMTPFSFVKFCFPINLNQKMFVPSLFEVSFYSIIFFLLFHSIETKDYFVFKSQNDEVDSSNYESWKNIVRGRRF